MFTIQDIANAEFEKSMRGYRPEAVHEFLAQLAAQIEQLSKEKEDLEKKLYILAGKVEEYRGEEDMLKTAMINAQRMGENVIREARQKADGILREADLKANSIEEKTKEKLSTEETSFAQLQQKVASFKGEVLAIYKKHIESLSELPAFDLEEDEAAASQNDLYEKAVELETEQNKYLEENSDDENIFAKTIYDTQPIIEPQEALHEIEPVEEISNKSDDIFGSIFGFNSEDEEENYDDVEIEPEADDTIVHNNDDTSDLDSLFGLNGVNYKSVSINEDEEDADEQDDTTIYQKAEEPSHFAHEEPKIIEETHNDAFKGFFDEENEDDFEKPPLKSSVFEKFNGINFKD